MAVSRAKAKGRRETGQYFGIPHAVMDSLNYIRLSALAKAMLLDLGRQYTGYNNGDLCAAFKLMRERGWRSRTTVDRALAELLHYGMIVKTRQGGRNAPNLYALTWNSIDDCGEKLDVQPTTVSSGDWKIDRPEFSIPNRKKNSLTCPGNGQGLPRKWATQGGIHANLPKI